MQVYSRRRRLSPEKRQELAKQLQKRFTKEPTSESLRARFKPNPGESGRRFMREDEVKAHVSPLFDEFKIQTEGKVDKKTQAAVDQLNERINTTLTYVLNTVQKKLENMPEPKDGHTPTQSEIAEVIAPFMRQVQRELTEQVRQIEQALKKPAKKSDLPKNLESLKELIRQNVPKQETGGGSGPGYFFELFDVPDKVGGHRGAYRGFEGKVLKVSADGKTLTFADEAGGGSGGAETPTGTVDGSNKDFTVDNEPKLVMTENGNYVENNGYTITGSGPYTISLTIAPSQWIRSLF